MRTVLLLCFCILGCGGEYDPEAPLQERQHYVSHIGELTSAEVGILAQEIRRELDSDELGNAHKRLRDALKRGEDCAECRGREVVQSLESVATQRIVRNERLYPLSGTLTLLCQVGTPEAVTAIHRVLSAANKTGALLDRESRVVAAVSWLSHEDCLIGYEDLAAHPLPSVRQVVERFKNQWRQKRGHN